jgi:alcohol dehydrogenase class IV
MQVQESQLEKLASYAFEDSCHANNPRTVHKADFVQLFNEAY